MPRQLFLYAKFHVPYILFPLFIAYRNWMNSMGVSPFVNRLYSDLSNGMVIFQLYDVIQKGTVDWNKVHQKFPNLRKVGLTNIKRLS